MNPEVKKQNQEIVKQSTETEFSESSKVHSYLEKANNPVKDVVGSSLKKSPELQSYIEQKDIELKNILEGKENKEVLSKNPEKVRKQILKEQYNPQTIDGYADMVKAEIAKNGGNLADKKDVAKAIEAVNDRIYKTKLDDLAQEVKDKDGNPVYDKEGKKIESKYGLILEKNPELAKLNNDKNPEFAKELIAVYGEKELSDLKPIFEQLKKEGKELPQNLEEFDEIMKELKLKISKENLAIEEDGLEPDDKTVKEMSRNMSLNTLSNYSRQALNMNIPGSVSGNDIPKGNLDDSRGREVINNLPDGQIKTGLLEAASYVGKGRNDPDLIKYTARGGRPSNERYYCKAFLNSAVMSMGYNIGKSALSMDGLKAGQPVQPVKEALPGDIIVISRNGTDTAGNPGSHTGIFLGWGNGGPIILSGNSTGGRVTIHEYKGRTVYGVRRVMNDKQAEDIKNNSTK